MARIDQWNTEVGKDLGVFIEARYYGSDYDDVLSLAASSGRLPHLFKPRTGLKEYIQRDAILPFENLPGGQDLVDEYEPFIQNGIDRIGGLTYRVPNIATTLRLVVNRDLLEKYGIVSLPKSWEDLAYMADIVTRESDGEAFGLALPFKWGDSGRHLWRLGLIYGFADTLGVHSWFNGSTGQYDFTPLEPVLSFVRQGREQGFLLPIPEDLDNDRARKAFADGLVAFIPGAGWDVGVYTSQFPVAKGTNWQVIRFPGPGKNSTPMIVESRIVSVVSSAYPDDLEETVTVLKEYIYHPEILAEGYSKGLYLPVLPKIDLELDAGTPPQWASFIPTSLDTIEQPFPDSFIDLEGQKWPEVLLTLTQTNNTSPGNPGEILENLSLQYNDALRLAVEDGVLDMDDYLK